MAEVGFQLSCDERELEGYLKEGLAERGIYPVSVEIDAEHATFLEFGTGPSSKGGVPYEEILAWFKTKHPAMPESEQKRAAYAIKLKIDKEGTEPHPFIRPALEWARDMGVRDRLEMGATMLDVGESIINQMRFILETNDNIYKWEVYDNMIAKRGSWDNEDRGGEFDVDRIMDEVRGL